MVTVVPLIPFSFSSWCSLSNGFSLISLCVPFVLPFAMHLSPTRIGCNLVLSGKIVVQSVCKEIICRNECDNVLQSVDSEFVSNLLCECIVSETLSGDCIVWVQNVVMSGAFRL